MSSTWPGDDRSYEVGRLLLTLRTRARLTQAALAAEVGVSRRTILVWEGGEAYPREERLRQLIAVLIRRGGFTRGAEREEAAALWGLISANAPQRLALLDAAWLDGLVASLGQAPPADEPPPGAPAPPAQATDWGEAAELPALLGREGDLKTLGDWLTTGSCRVIALLGMGGIGKTSLATAFARRQSASFERVIFRSLRNGPPLSQLLDTLIRFISAERHANLPQGLPDRLALLLALLHERRCLIVLDNLETIMQDGLQAGRYRPGYADYALMVQRVAEAAHGSCLILTSREKPLELVPLEGRGGPVRTLALQGLAEEDCQAILEGHQIEGSDADWGALSRRYGGNPLALKLVAEPIRELFDGDIAAFLSGERAIFGSLRYLLDQQFDRLSPLEQDALTWLAICREPLGLDELRAYSTHQAGPRERLEALEALRRRFLIERGAEGPGFTLQPVVQEYVTELLIEQIREEVVAGAPEGLRRYGLMQAQAREYVRQSQARVILRPLLSQLAVALRQPQHVEARLRDLLAATRQLPLTEQGYAGGNVVNLLVQLGHDLRGYDFSHMQVWGAYLADVELPGVDFRGADLSGSIFTETFTTIVPVAFSPDGRVLAAGSVNGGVWLWRVADHQQIGLLRGHGGPVNAVAFSPDGRLIATASTDGQVGLWSAAQYVRLASLAGHAGRVWAVAWSADGRQLASAGDDQTIRIWEVATAECVAALGGHEAAVAAVAFSPDGARLASASHDPAPTVKVWDLGTGQCQRTLAGHSADIWSVLWSPDGALIASAGADRAVLLWDVSAGELRASLVGHTARIRALAWSADGARLASGSLDQTVRVWDVASRSCAATLAANTGPVNGVAWSPDGDTLACGGELQAIALWSADQRECLAMLYGYNNGVLTLSFAADGRTLASAGFDRSIRLWSHPAGGVRARLIGHSGVVYAIAHSPDGAMLVSGGGGSDGSARVWAEGGAAPLATFDEHAGPLMAVAWSCDGRTIASGSLDQTIKLWSLLSPASQATLRGHTDAVRALAFSPVAATLLASASYDRSVRLWDTARGVTLRTLAGHAGPVRVVTFSRDGALLASGSADQTVRLWDVSDGACLAVLHGHSGEVVSAAFSPDGALLATGGFDGTIRIWALADGACRTVLDPQGGVIYALAFSPDGATLASGSADGATMLWDAPAYTPRATWRTELPYAAMQISGATGITLAQRTTLELLGAI